MSSTRPKTVFCDIDGTLVEHASPIHAADPEHIMNVLPAVHKKLLEWDSKGYNIILTTGRKESLRKVTEDQLSHAGIIYDQLVMGLGGGDRILINDRKLDGRSTARAIRIDRNLGVGSISVSDLEALALDYFSIFENKDLSSLNSIFSDDITLRDWNTSAEGKTNVLSANEDIFNSCKEISISVKKSYVCDMTVIAEIVVEIDDTTEILVTDIIEFDDRKKIKSVTAYKGN